MDTPVNGASASGNLPTRLETQIKESNMCASHWDQVETQRFSESVGLAWHKAAASC